MPQKATRGSGWRKGIQNKLKRRGSLILAPIFALSVISTSTGFSSVSQASVEPGIDVTVYDNSGYNSSPPLPEVSGVPITGTTTYPSIDQNFDAAPPFNLYEYFIVKYQGHITSPITGDILFWPQADDGTMFYLDGVLIDSGSWVDKGGDGQITEPQSFTAGISKPFTYWYYENGGGAWTTLYWNLGNGWEIVPPSAFTKTATVAPTTTTLAPYFNPVTNLQGVANSDGSVDLSWEQPEPSNLDIFAYTVSFFKLEQDTESGGWGVWTENTSINLGPWMWTGTTGYGDIRFKIRPGTAACFAPSDLECQYGPEQSIDFLVEDPTPPTTTTTTTTTTLPPIIIETTTTTIPIVEETIPTWTTTTTSTTTTTTTVALTPTVTVETTEVATTSTTTTTQAPILQQTEQPQTTTTTLPPPVATTTTTTTLPPEQKAPVPAAATTIALIQTVDELKKLVETVDLETIEPDQAVALVTNAAFIELPKDQLSEVFESLPISDLSPEQEAVLVATLSDAPSEVKNTFESAVDVYGSGLDEYVPEGSSVDVGTRRSVIAVTTVMASVAAAGAAPGVGGGSSGGPSSGGSGGSSGSPSDANKAARREEEQEDEEAGGLEGPEDREKNLNTRNSIYNYKENDQKEFSIMGFIKKFLKETAALSFTFAGSAIMFVTLSGDTRRIAIIATAAAVAVHYIYVMLENDEE
jgi:hypothetical protein